MVMEQARVAVGYREEFGTRQGVHQGSVLSLLLSIILLEVLSNGFELVDYKSCYMQKT